MKIELKQTCSEMSNEFEIRYGEILQYKAELPFVSVKEPLNLEKIRSIKIMDLSGNIIYTTNYNYVENFKEELIPLKYLVTGSQKFNQLLFISNNNIIKIYYEEKAIWDNRYVIEINDKKYFCYSIEDGNIRHFPIYNGELQVGEALKSNVVIDGKDEYICYLKDEYKHLGDGIVALLLYLDRSQYSSSYLINKSYTYTKKYSYNKTNKFYDKEWVKNNFGDEFYKKVENDIILLKQKLKKPLKTFKEQWNSMSSNQRFLMKFVILFPWVIIVLVLLIVLLSLLVL